MPGEATSPEGGGAQFIAALSSAGSQLPVVTTPSLQKCSTKATVSPEPLGPRPGEASLSSQGEGI